MQWRREMCQPLTYQAPLCDKTWIQDTFMKIEGKIVDILKRIDPKMYEKYIITENGHEVLYVKLKKALYGTLQASLLFWKNLTATLIVWGFEINPYDWCVANRMVNG